MRTFSANHKPLPELDIDPADIPLIVAEAKKLEHDADTGDEAVSFQLARNLGGWLVEVHTPGDGRDHSTATDNAKSRYRKILRRLDTLGKLPKPPAYDSEELVARRRRYKEAGYAEVGTVGATAAAMMATVVALSTSNAALAGAVGSAGLYITYSDGIEFDSGEESSSCADVSASIVRIDSARSIADMRIRCAARPQPTRADTEMAA